MKASFAFLLLIFLTPLSASAWSGPIQFPELNYSQSLDAARQKKAATILKFMKDDLKFIKGRFFGTHSTTQSFGGTSAQTAKMIGLLRDADIWDLTVQFVDLKKQEIAFDISMNYRQSVVITVNSAREDFLLKDFVPFLNRHHFPASDDGKPSEVTLEELQKSAADRKPSTPAAGKDAE